LALALCHIQIAEAKERSARSLADPPVSATLLKTKQRPASHLKTTWLTQQVKCWARPVGSDGASWRLRHRPLVA